MVFKSSICEFCSAQLVHRRQCGIRNEELGREFQTFTALVLVLLAAQRLWV